MSKSIVETDKAAQAIGPYSQAIKTDGFVFVSGQLPLDPLSGTLVEGDIEKQTHQVMSNLKGILEASGSSLQSVVKNTIFLTNMDDFPQVNEMYGQYFSSNPPARSCIEVSALPKGARIEIESIALLER